MKRTQVKGIYQEYWSRIPYQLIRWDEWDYSHLKKIMWERPAGRGNKKTFNDVIIGIDTETSKTKTNEKRADGSWIPVPNRMDNIPPVLWQKPSYPMGPETG